MGTGVMGQILRDKIISIPPLLESRLLTVSIEMYIRHSKQNSSTVTQPRFNEALYNEILGITNDIFQPSNSVMYGKEPRYNEPSI